MECLNLFVRCGVGLAGSTELADFTLELMTSLAVGIERVLVVSDILEGDAGSFKALGMFCMELLIGCIRVGWWRIMGDRKVDKG